MGKERAQKKSFQHSLDDIKERMKEKRNKRLASASAPSKRLSRMMNKSGGTNSTHSLLKGVQENNKALAVALQSEKEKGRQANAVILQLKKEQQALFLHLILLKKKLKEQEALVAKASETKPANVIVEPQRGVDSERRKRTSQILDELILCDASPICAEPQPPKKNGKQITLPPTVCVRRQHTDRRSRRRSERVREQRLAEEDPASAFEALIASPTRSDSRNPVHHGAESCDIEEIQHSTPEPVHPKKSQQQPSKKQPQQQQPRSKPEPASRKPERGRKPERAPLKKPWENPKPRARSKSRDRSATRAKNAPPPQGNKLNTSLGFNDTFDFDCEEVVHVTPFKAKAEETQPATAISEEAPERGEAQTEVSPRVSKSQNESSSSSPSSESEDSLYVPQKTRRRLTSPDKTRDVTTRRGRPSKVTRRRENIPPKPQISVFRDEESSLKAAESEGDFHHLPDSSLPNSPDAASLGKENHPEPHGEDTEQDGLLPVSPQVEAEMMRIDNVLSNFGDSSCETPPFLPHHTQQKNKTTCKKPYRKFSCGGSRPSDARCGTPVPARKRRCTMVVDYKEPSLNAKLRRGDKHTDLQFLRSPVFKEKSGRRSEQKSRNSMNNQQRFKKYNESFVGCH
ncbi:shugoshin 1 isoform X2 [Mugil cephalus]|uniref:shugoshin 1 isoform X2 n=1 Tax=Mugil cephalus TaxID=48193 RepID=UPI001FB7F2C0|nr:shugoshin 1 isoform X2 [Mugil cephalus]